MITDSFVFKRWVVILNLACLVLFSWLVFENLPHWKFVFNDIYALLIWIMALWILLCKLGYSALLYLPNGIALELHDDYLLVCSPTGMKKIPREGVRGCKQPVHRMTQGKNAGLVTISVTPQYRVIGPYGFRVNPSFYGASVVGETEQTLVTKIRAWRQR